MNFDYTDDQVMLRDSVTRLLNEHCSFEQRRAAVEQDKWSRINWRRFAELGLLGLRFPTEAGGFGGGPTETMVVMEALGRALSIEPYLATVVLCGHLLRLAASEEQRADLIPGIMDGGLVLAFAQAEQQSRYDLHDVSTTATHNGKHWILDGEKRHVVQGGSADMIIVSARTEGARRDRSGIGLFLVDATGDGVDVRSYRSQDGHSAAQIRLCHAEATAQLGSTTGALPAIEEAVAHAIAALCAEAVGVMDRALEITLEHLKTRHQFGVPIGSFQVLQHRAVDMLVRIEEARSMAIYAAMMCDDPDTAARDRGVAMAKVKIGQAGKFVGEQSIQLHGGMGMTNEHPVGHLYRRLMMIELMFGDTGHHLSRLAEDELSGCST